MSNETRISSGEAIMQKYICIDDRFDGLREGAIDLMTNLFHYLNSEGIDPHDIAYMAMTHFEIESNENESND